MIDKIVKGIQGIASSAATRQASLSLLRSQVMKRLSTQALSKAGNAVAKKISQGWLKKYVKSFASNMKTIDVLKVDATLPKIRNHIADNIIQKKYTVLSSYLGREGAFLRVLNRRAALSRPVQPNGEPAKKEPGSPNNSFDEYPFASSLQGATLFPDWSTVMAVPGREENSKQGGLLNAHYRKNGYKPGFTTIVLPMGYGPDSTELEQKAKELLGSLLNDLLGH